MIRRTFLSIAAASAIPCQPGSISSQIPTGRSNRPSFSQGRSAGGANRSTQLLGAASGRGAAEAMGRELADLAVLLKCRWRLRIGNRPNSVP